MTRVLLLWLASAGSSSCMTRGSTQQPGAASGSTGPAPSALVEAAPPSPGSEAECRACNGEWKVHGPGPTPSCNCRARDAGKLCYDGDECEGLCITKEQPDIELVEPGPPARGRFKGRCSDLIKVFGCHRFIPRGASRSGLVHLHMPPKKICFD